MKNYIKTILIMSFMYSSTIAFAFPADPDVTPDPPAPIDNYIFVLVFFGIGFAIWHQYKKAEKV